MRKKSWQYLRAARLSDDRFMPDTQRQGWGQVTGERTDVIEVEDNGVRTRKRERKGSSV